MRCVNLQGTRIAKKAIQDAKIWIFDLLYGIYSLNDQ